MDILFLDGPVGTLLNARGVSTPAPLWSAVALSTCPDMVRQIHQEYAAAGATVHTANTFRTRQRAAGASWRALTQQAVHLARLAIGDDHRLAGSIAPLEDCYRPDLSPPNPGPEHAEMAQALVDAGCDLLLCETFPHVGEGLSAVEAAVQTGVETWISFTAGYNGDLLTPKAVGAAAKEAVQRGARAVLINCTPARQTLAYVQHLSAAGAPFGAYANAGHPSDGLGWVPTEDGPERYADLAETWINAGATIVGSCCGTTPATIAALRARFG